MKKYFENIKKYLQILFNGVRPLRFCAQKKSKIIAFSFLCFVGAVYPVAKGAEYSLEQLRIANVLANEVGTAGERSMTLVAEVMRNRYTEQNQKKGRNTITYSDILFHSYGGAGSDSDFSGARKKFANKNKSTLMTMGRNKMASDAGWNMALRLAGQLLSGTLHSNYAKGANSFHGCDKKYTTLALAQKCQKGKVLVLDVMKNASRNHVFYNMELGTFTPAYKSDEVAQVSDYNYSASKGGQASADSDGSEEAGVCAMEAMSAMYLTDDSKVDQYCWYCKIVIVLINSYLSVVNDALGATTSLGKMILKLGFLIWLAYYVLQQVSSMKAVTIGKMLQEISVMGFKVAIAYLAVGMGTQLIRDYYLDPIVGTGVDYGLALFRQLNLSQNLGGEVVCD